MKNLARFRASTIPGSKRGRALGTPTINLDLKNVPADLSDGIYACRATLFRDDGSSEGPYPAAMHYGPRTMFGDTRSCEVHLIDISPSDHPAHVEVEVIARLREVKEYAYVEELQEQMERDVEEARKILKQ